MSDHRVGWKMPGQSSPWDQMTPRQRWEATCATDPRGHIAMAYNPYGERNPIFQDTTGHEADISAPLGEGDGA